MAKHKWNKIGPSNTYKCIVCGCIKNGRKVIPEYTMPNGMIFYNRAPSCIKKIPINWIRVKDDLPDNDEALVLFAQWDITAQGATILREFIGPWDYVKYFMKDQLENEFTHWTYIHPPLY